jgi:hypothetical protein
VVSGPAGVLALVLAESAAGGAGYLFLTPLWKEVRRGFFVLTGVVVLILALATAGAASAGFDSTKGTSGRTGMILALALAAATLLWLCLMAARQSAAARVLGVATVPLAVVMLAFFADATKEGLTLAFVQLLAGALFTGAVLDGLLLGHWYLTDRRLTRGPINRMAWLLIGAVVVEGVAVIIGGIGPNGRPGISAGTTISPLLTVAGSATWIAFGMVACTGLIAGFIRATLRGTRPTAVQSATGFFYLAVITALTAELAAKVRFLP